MTTRERNVHLPLDQILAFCRHHPILKLSLFGSALREDFSETSDVDLLVEFTPDSGITYFSMAEMEAELGRMVGRKVDLRTPGEISRRFKHRVLESAEILYARG